MEGVLRPVGSVRNQPHTMLWVFYGFSACSLATACQNLVRATYGFRKDCVRAPYGPLRIVRDWKHRLISHAGTVGACEYPLDQSCSKCKHGLNISGQTWSCVIWLIQAPVQTTGLIRAQSRRKPVYESYVCSTFSQGLYGARTAPKCSTARAGPHGMLFSGLWPLRNP